jgi:hypothetical protein
MILLLRAVKQEMETLNDPITGDGGDRWAR